MIPVSIAPIVLFVYDRLDHVRDTVISLKKNLLACHSELFIYSDGPKDDEQTKAKVGDVRAYIKTVAGFKNITIIESELNRGLADSTIRGVSDIVEKYGKVIVLEDDLESSPDFLRFMNEALDKYENEKQVMQISGHMFNCSISDDMDAVFLPFINSIGWATWKRSWDLFDPLMVEHEKIKASKKLKFQFNLDGAYGYSQMLEKQLEGKIDSWAIRWYLSVFLNNGLVLYPVKSLIKHIGFDESGTHATQNNCVYAQCWSRLPDKDIQFPRVALNADAYSCVKTCLAPGYRNSNQMRSISFGKSVVERILHLFGS